MATFPATARNNHDHDHPRHGPNRLRRRPLPLEVGVALLIFLCRDGFTTRFVEHGTSSVTPMAAMGQDAAITALNAGELP
jgi:hypothetical protein